MYLWVARGNGFCSCGLQVRTLTTSLQLLYREDFKLLGIPENASADQIRAAYFRKAKEFHPDSRSGDSQDSADFIALTEAYKRLIFEQKTGGVNFDYKDPRCDPRRSEYWDLRRRKQTPEEIEKARKLKEESERRDREIVRKIMLVAGVFIMGLILPSFFVGGHEFKDGCNCDKCSLIRMKRNPSTKTLLSMRSRQGQTTEMQGQEKAADQPKDRS